MHEQLTTETLIVVAIRCASGLCKEGANLPSRFGEQTRVVVRLVAHHLRDQEIKIIGHTLPRTPPGVRRPNGHSSEHA